MTTATSGTGTITLGSAVSGFLTFAEADVVDEDIVSYGISDGANSEVGYGTYTSAGTTLARTTILKSTNSDAAIDLSGAAVVFITALKENIGDVVGPAGATTDHLAVFDGATGKLIKDGGAVPASSAYTEGARVYNDANLVIGTGSDTVLAFNTERYDTDTIHAAGDNTKLTCKTAGIYIIGGHCDFAFNANGIRQLFIKLDNTTDIGRLGFTNVTATTDTRMSICTVYSLSVNQYVQLVAYQSSGGNLNVLVAGNRSPEFWMQRIG